MSIYTIIWEYRGGTYIQQVSARSARSALLSWSQAIKIDEISGLGTKRLARLQKEIVENTEGPTALAGLANAWCAGSLLGGLLNIVKTEISS